MGIPQDIEALGALIDAVDQAVDALIDRAGDTDIVLAGILARVNDLEAYVIRNDQRITLIEAFMADHQAGAERRQREVNQALQAAQRARWQQRTGRQA